MTDSRQWNALAAVLLLAGVWVAVPVFGEVVWGGVWRDLFGPLRQETAQRFSGFGGPDLILGDSFEPFGSFDALAISGNTLVSGRDYSVYRWNAYSGEPIGPLELDSPLDAHLQAELHSIGTTSGGDLLFTSYGFATRRRPVARYSADGTWIRDYDYDDLQHVQGSPAGTDAAVFVASRYTAQGEARERILMFAEDGTFLGRFGSELGNDVADVAVMGDHLYALNYADGIFVYDLDGASTPEFSHLIPFPDGVDPEAGATDGLTATGGFLYVTESPELAVLGDPGYWHKLNLAGELVGSYEAEFPIYARYNYLGPCAVIPEPATVLILSLGAGLVLRRRR